MTHDTRELFAIVGLGNYGSQYVGTRHNIGFEIIEALAERIHFRDSSFYSNYYFTSGSFGGKHLILCKPWTYMNLSGNAVSVLVHAHSIEVEKLLIVCDDIALPLGQLRFRTRGSSGGHNGLQSIIDIFGNHFPRLRCGVGSPPADQDYADYVLSAFHENEVVIKKEMIQKAVDAIILFLNEGISKAMTIFNASISNGIESENNNSDNETHIDT